VDLHPYGLRESGSHTVDERGKATVTSSAQFASANYASVVLALTALGLLLLNLNLSHPNTYVYDYWLDNTVGAISFAPVGALIAARRPENPVGWLLCLYGVALSIGHFSAQYASYTLLAQPNSLPAGEVLAWTASWILARGSAQPERPRTARRAAPRHHDRHP
jgi:hypothetical protein